MNNVDQFNAGRKARGATLAIIATQELKRRLASRARHATVFTMSDTRSQNTKAKKKDFDDPARKFRAAVYVVIASNEIKHWIDSEETLLHDPTLKQHQHVLLKKPRAVGEKYNPRRTFKAAVYAIMFMNELHYWWLDPRDLNKRHLLPSSVRDRVELRAHVQEMFAWLGEHTTRPSFVHEFYRDHDVIHDDMLADNRKQHTLKSGVYAVHFINKMENMLRRKKLEAHVKDRLDYLSGHIPEK
ncbi:MAG: hypothetical protein SGARI_006567, partial [Bacillariaceae sp.]